MVLNSGSWFFSTVGTVITTHTSTNEERVRSQTWRHMWVEFVGSLLCSERFFPPGFSDIPSPPENNPRI